MEIWAKLSDNNLLQCFVIDVRQRRAQFLLLQQFLPNFGIFKHTKHETSGNHFFNTSCFALCLCR